MVVVNFRVEEYEGVGGEQWSESAGDERFVNWRKCERGTIGDVQVMLRVEVKRFRYSLQLQW